VAIVSIFDVNALKPVYNAHMALLHSVTVTAWECGACHWQWIPRGEDIPKQCPNRECRQRLKKAEVMPNDSRTTMPLSTVRKSKERDAVTGEHRAVKTSAGKKMSADEFMKLSKSDQMRTRREGRF
jgi:hypothetical protein